MARGKKAEFSPLVLDETQFADAISAGFIEVKPVDVVVDAKKDSNGRKVKGSETKVSVRMLQAKTDEGVAILLSESGHLRRAANRYVQSEYALRTKRLNQPFEKQFSDSIDAYQRKHNCSREKAVEVLRSVLE